MPSKKSLNRENIEALGAQRLAVANRIGSIEDRLILPAKSLADGARPAYRKEMGDGSIAVQFASSNSKIDN